MNDLLHPTLLAIDNSGDDDEDKAEEVDAAAAGADAPDVCDTRGDCSLPDSVLSGDVIFLLLPYLLPTHSHSLSLCVCVCVVTSTCSSSFFFFFGSLSLSLSLFQVSSQFKK